MKIETEIKISAKENSSLIIKKMTKQEIELAENLGSAAFIILCGAFSDEAFLIPKNYKEDHPIKKLFLLFGFGVSPFMTLCNLYGGKKLNIKPLTAYEQLRISSFLVSKQNEKIPICKNAVLAIEKIGITSRTIRAKKRIKMPVLLIEELNTDIKFTTCKDETQ